MAGFFDAIRKLFAWPCQPMPPVGGPYRIAAGWAAVAGGVAGEVFTAGGVAGVILGDVV